MGTQSVTTISRFTQGGCVPKLVTALQQTVSHATVTAHESDMTASLAVNKVTAATYKTSDNKVSV